MNRFGLISLGLCLAVTVPAQETPGVANTESKGAVIKGRAPVAKDLLRVRFPKPKSLRLKNGLQVYILEDHRAPVVRFNLQMDAGSLFEQKPGVAFATAQMLTEGTASRSYLDIGEITERTGANLGANADLDTATLSASCLTPAVDEVLDLMSDVLLHPSFPTERLDRIRFAQRSMNRQRRTNPAGLINDLTARVFYGGTRYAKTQPTPDDLAALKAEDLQSFHDAYYRPNGAILGVTGDVDASKLQARLEAAFAGWKAAPTEAQLPAADFRPLSNARIFLIDRPSSAQTVLSFGSLAVKESDADFIPLTVANRILGGGSSGRLFQNIREKKGYTYGAYSTLSAGLWPGLWSASASVRTEVTEPAIHEFFAEFERLRTEPVSQEELNRAKRSIIGGFARTLETPEGILQRTLELVQNKLPANFWDTYPAKIEAVSPTDVQRVAKRYLTPPQVQLLAVGERSKIETGLAKYGVVTIVDPSKLKSMETP